MHLYKLLIVDDDTVIRTTLRSLIDWQAEGFLLVGDAVNGAEAYKMIKNNPVDVVITDIKMPAMDGLQLLEKLSHHENPPLALVLSAYTDYPLVRQAFKYGAVDYIIKSEITNATLHRSLELIKDELVQAQRPTTTLPKSKTSYDWLHDLVAGRPVRAEDFQVERYMLVVFELENFMHEAKRFGEDLDGTLIQPVINFALQVPGMATHGIITYMTPSRYLYLFYAENTSEGGALYTVETISKNIMYMWKTYMNLSATVGISAIHTGRETLDTAMEQALTNLSLKLVMGAGGVYSQSTYTLFDPTRALTQKDSYHRLLSAVKSGDPIVEDLVERDILLTLRRLENMEEVHRMCLDILYHLSMIFWELHDDFLSVFGAGLSFYEKVAALRDIRDAEMWLSSVMHGAARYISDNHISARTYTMERAEKYILAHYTDPLLTLGDVAHHVGFTDNYFSTWFHKERGTPFREYLATLRIGLAKDLMNKTDMKVYEISEAVGYNSVEHFTRKFKKHTGMNPSEYKG